jgi:WD40 repeat protein
MSVAFDPAGRMIALARDDGVEMLSLTGASWHYGETQARCPPAWSPDGARVAVAAGDRHEAVILAANDRAVCATVALTGVPQFLAFHPDGTLLAAASDDATVALCEAATGTAWTSLAFAAQALEFTADGRELLVSASGGAIHAWRVSLPVAWHEWPESPRNKSDGPVYSMALSPGGARLLTVSMGCVAVWSVPEERQTGFRLLENQRIDAPASAFWLTNSTILLQVPGGLERLTVDASGMPGASERLPRVPGSTVLNVQPDGGWLVKLKDEDGKESCELWPDGNAAAAQPAPLQTALPPTITAIHADGQQASLTNGDIIEWRRPSGPEMRLTAPLNPGVRALQFSPDGRRLFVLTRQHRMFSWDFDKLSAALDARGL